MDNGAVCRGYNIQQQQSSIVVDRLIRRDTENEKKRDPKFWRGYRRMTDDIIAHFHARLQT
eukprot:scaffold4020_cov234-Chaetoceros_neogracile.AAC.4